MKDLINTNAMNLPTSPFWLMERNAFNQMTGIMSRFSPDEIKSVIAEFNAAPVDDARRMGLPVVKHEGFAIIGINGVLMKNDGFFLRFFGGTSTRNIEAAVNAGLADDEVHTILLAIDSPGGSTDGIQELADTIFEARGTKNIIAHIDGVGASAALWIASQAVSITATNSSIVGSIGARMEMFDTSKMFEDIGIKTIAIDTGVHKSTGLDGTVITEEQIEPFQDIVDGFFDDFLNSMIRSRTMPEDDLRAIADGRVFKADKAFSLGLIDNIGRLESLIQASGHRDKDKDKKRRRATLSSLKLQFIKNSN